MQRARRSEVRGKLILRMEWTNVRKLESVRTLKEGNGRL